MDKVKKSKDLPLGHYGINDAKESMNKEYVLARLAEKDIPFQNVTDSAPKICAKVCITLGIPKIKALKLGENIWPAGADYCNRIIRFNGDQIYLKVLLHELAHHVQFCEKGFDSGHGEGFVSALNFVIEAWRN